MLLSQSFICFVVCPAGWLVLLSLSSVLLSVRLAGWCCLVSLSSVLLSVRLAGWCCLVSLSSVLLSVRSSSCLGRSVGWFAGSLLTTVARLPELADSARMANVFVSGHSQVLHRKCRTIYLLHRDARVLHVCYIVTHWT